MILNVHSIPSYLIYAAVLVRAVAWTQEESPVQVVVIALLAAFGLVMISEPLVTRRIPRFPYLYLIFQSGLVLFMLLEAPVMDFLATLFFPLSFQAVQFFKRRLGFLWIGAFTLAMSAPILLGWEWELSGLVTAVLLGGLNYLAGSYAHLIQRAEIARQENQRLLGELEQANYRLQDQAAQIEELAVLQERSRLARELHDSVTQTLFSMNLTVQAARMLVEKEPAHVAGQLDRLQELAGNATGEIRTLARQLRPLPLAGETLVAGLIRLANERQRRDGLQVHLEVQGEKGLSEPVTAGLYRIVQEALNNVARHAKVCEALVRLDLVSQPAYLEVVDRGAGFEPGKLSQNNNHIGLSSMAERAGEIGWTLKIHSQPGRGTCIRVEEAENGEAGGTAPHPA